MGKSRIYRSCLLICTLFVCLCSHAQGVATPNGTVTAQTDATLTWSCDYATEYPLPYPDDAIFCYPLNTYTAMRFHSTGNITVTVTGANAMGYSYTFAKTFYVPSSYD